MQGNILNCGRIEGASCDYQCDKSKGKRTDSEGGWLFWNHPPFFTKWYARKCDRIKWRPPFPGEQPKYVDLDGTVKILTEFEMGI